jgi:hypothetical protein
MESFAAPTRHRVGTGRARHSTSSAQAKLDIGTHLHTALPAKGTPRRDNDAACKTAAKRPNVLPSRTENLAVCTRRRVGTKNTQRSTSPARAPHRSASPGLAHQTNTARRRLSMKDRSLAHRRHAIVTDTKPCYARSVPSRHQAHTAQNVTRSS